MTSLVSSVVVESPSVTGEGSGPGLTAWVDDASVCDWRRSDRRGFFDSACSPIEGLENEDERAVRQTE